MPKAAGEAGKNKAAGKGPAGEYDHYADLPGPDFKPRPASQPEKKIVNSNIKKSTDIVNFPRSYFAATAVAKMVAGPASLLDFSKNAVAKAAFESTNSRIMPNHSANMPDVDMRPQFIVYGRRQARHVIAASRPGDFLLFPLLTIIYCGHDDHLLQSKVKGWNGNGFVARNAYNLTAIASGRFGFGNIEAFEDYQNRREEDRQNRQSAREEPW